MWMLKLNVGRICEEMCLPFEIFQFQQAAYNQALKSHQVHAFITQQTDCHANQCNLRAMRKRYNRRSHSHIVAAPPHHRPPSGTTGQHITPSTHRRTVGRGCCGHAQLPITETFAAKRLPSGARAQRGRLWPTQGGGAPSWWGQQATGSLRSSRIVQHKCHPQHKLLHLIVRLKRQPTGSGHSDTRQQPGPETPPCPSGPSLVSGNLCVVACSALNIYCLFTQAH